MLKQSERERDREQSMRESGQRGSHGERERDRQTERSKRGLEIVCIIYIDNINIEIHLNKTYLCLDLLLKVFQYMF